MKPISGKRMRKILEQGGWTLVRVAGSHFIYGRPGQTAQPCVPVHGNHDLKPRTQRTIMKQAGLTETDL